MFFFLIPPPFLPCGGGQVFFLFGGGGSGETLTLPVHIARGHVVLINHQTKGEFKIVGFEWFSANDHGQPPTTSIPALHHRTKFVLVVILSSFKRGCSSGQSSSNSRACIELSRVLY